MRASAVLIDGIGELTTNDDSNGGRIHDAAVVIEHGVIAWVGASEAAPPCDSRIDANGRAVLPGWVDSHTHLIFAGDRTAEFEARMAGESYVAGGINATVDASRAATNPELVHNLERHIREAHLGGTTTLETKTGYGLTVADEVRMARLAQPLVDAVTFLGAHIVPEGIERTAYLDSVTGTMLSEVAPYVTAVDVFSERGAFDSGETTTVLKAARALGLHTHVHGNQLSHGPGVQLAVEHGSLSVDHVNYLEPEDISALAESWKGAPQTTDGTTNGTVATLLPACDLSTRMPFPPARQLIDSGAQIAIATNCNPGTSYTTSMGFAVATAVLQMHLTVPEAVRAATLGGATALGMHRDNWKNTQGQPQPAVGVIRPGAQANLQLIEAPSVTHFAYRPGVPLATLVWKNGIRITQHTTQNSSTE